MSIHHHGEFRPLPTFSSEEKTGILLEVPLTTNKKDHWQLIIVMIYYAESAAVPGLTADQSDYHSPFRLIPADS